MSFRGNRGGFRGRGQNRGRGGFRGKPFNDEPPEYVVELGQVMHPCQEDLVCKCTNEKVSFQVKKTRTVINV